MIPYLWGAFMYVAASKNTKIPETLTPKQRKEKIQKIDNSWNMAIAMLSGAVVGGLVAITLEINTPQKVDDNLSLANTVQQVQVYDVGSNYLK